MNSKVQMRFTYIPSRTAKSKPGVVLVPYTSTNADDPEVQSERTPRVIICEPACESHTFTSVNEVWTIMSLGLCTQQIFRNMQVLFYPSPVDLQALSQEKYCCKVLGMLLLVFADDARQKCYTKTLLDLVDKGTS